MWFSGRGGDESTVGLDDLKDHFQPYWCYDTMNPGQWRHLRLKIAAGFWCVDRGADERWAWRERWTCREREKEEVVGGFPLRSWCICWGRSLNCSTSVSMKVARSALLGEPMRPVCNNFKEAPEKKIIGSMKGTSTHSIILKFVEFTEYSQIHRIKES